MSNSKSETTEWRCLAIDTSVPQKHVVALRRNTDRGFILVGVDVPAAIPREDYAGAMIAAGVAYARWLDHQSSLN